MKVDSLRAHLIIVWLGGLALTSGAIGVELFLAEHLTSSSTEALFRNLLGCLLPTIGLMTALYFVPELANVNLTKGQQHVSLILSYFYLGAVLAVTSYVIWGGDNLAQTKGNSYQSVLELQPIIIGIISYIFGKGEKQHGQI